MPLRAGCRLLHRRCEKSIAEEIQRAAEDHAGVIPGLQAGNQEGVLSDSVRVLKREVAFFNNILSIFEHF